MNKYESVIIINPNLEDAKIKEVTERFSKLVNEHGKMEKVEDMGKKKLVYPIAKNTEAFYEVLYFEAESAFVAELERVYRITDEVLKFIVVKVEE